MMSRDAQMLLKAARELAQGERVAHAERQTGAFTLVLARRHQQVLATLAHWDRLPSAEEVLAVLDVFGAPPETPFSARKISLLSQDGHYRRTPAITATWREA